MAIIWTNNINDGSLFDAESVQEVRDRIDAMSNNLVCKTDYNGDFGTYDVNNDDIDRDAEKAPNNSGYQGAEFAGDLASDYGTYWSGVKSSEDTTEKSNHCPTYCSTVDTGDLSGYNITNRTNDDTSLKTGYQGTHNITYNGTEDNGYKSNDDVGYKSNNNVTEYSNQNTDHKSGVNVTNDATHFSTDYTPYNAFEKGTHFLSDDGSDYASNCGTNYATDKASNNSAVYTNVYSNNDLTDKVSYGTDGFFVVYGTVNMANNNGGPGMCMVV